MIVAEPRFQVFGALDIAIVRCQVKFPTNQLITTYDVDSISGLRVTAIAKPKYALEVQIFLDRVFWGGNHCWQSISRSERTGID